MSKASASASETEKQMKARGRRPNTFIVLRCLESLMKHEARVSNITSQIKQYRFIQCHIFGISFVKCCNLDYLLYLAIWYYNMCETFRFRRPKTVVEGKDLVDKAIPTSTKCKNKWAVTTFSEWPTARKFEVPVLDSSDLSARHFMNYE